MGKLDPSLVVSARDYAAARSTYRSKVATERHARRICLGADGWLQFETREFALWHVHELLRVEGWSLPRLQQTVRDVEPWCPSAGELTATLMLDCTDPARTRSIAWALGKPGAIRLRCGTTTMCSEVVEAGTSSDPIWYLRWSAEPGSLAPSPGTCILAWAEAPITISAATLAALRTDLREASGPFEPLLHRLISFRQFHVQSQRPRHQACP